MLIIDANWEERNTGFKTGEIIFEQGDSFNSYLDSDIENRFQIIVVKIPVGDLKLVHQMEDIGYRYLENQMVLSFEVNQIDNVNPKWERLLKGSDCKLLTTREEINFLLNEIKGNMFESDRISLDPFWGKGTSAKRYISWITDLYEKGTARFYGISHYGEQIGFFSMKKESGKIQSCPIAGIYNKYKSSGYIFVLTYYWLLQSKKFGTKRLITSVSSNNRNILSSLSKIFYFRINETNIVLRKLIKQGLS